MPVARQAGPSSGVPARVRRTSVAVRRRLVRLGVHGRREAPPGDAGEEVRGGHRGHPAAGRRRRRRDVRDDEAVVHRDQRVVGRERLRVGDVERGGEDRPHPEGVHQGPRVDDRSTRRVDEDRGRPHRPQRRRVDQVARLRVEAHVQRDEVGRRQQLRQRHPRRAGLELDVRRRPRAGAVQHAHAEARGPARDRLPDAPEADDPERRAVHVGSEQRHRAPRPPPAVAHVAVAFHDAAGRRPSAAPRPGPRSSRSGPRACCRRGCRAACRRPRRCCRSRPRSSTRPAGPDRRRRGARRPRGR